jgi:hypothetical protein
LGLAAELCVPHLCSFFGVVFWIWCKWRVALPIAARFGLGWVRLGWVRLGLGLGLGSGQVRSGQVRSGQVRSGQVWFGLG